MSFLIDRVGITQLRAKFGRLRATGQTGELNKDIVRQTVKYTKAIAPGPHHPQRGKRKATGALVAGIRGVYGKKRSGVISETPQHRDGRMRPYNLWMHGLGVYKGVRTGETKPLSGEVAYMFKGMRFMRKLVRSEYRQKIREILK